MTMEAGKAYIAPAGTTLAGEGWQEIGWAGEDGFRLADPDTSPVYRLDTARSLSVTFTLKHRTYLEQRAFVRLFAGPGYPLPSLIHNGGKRRRNHRGRRRYQ